VSSAQPSTVLFVYTLLWVNNLEDPDEKPKEFRVAATDIVDAAFKLKDVAGYDIDILTYTKAGRA
jgi:hypothetical protein